MITIKNAKIILPHRIIDGSLSMKNGKITNVSVGNMAGEGAVYDAHGLYVSPGFIDMHTHGGGGYDYMDGTVEAFVGAANTHLKHGTTSLLPTTVCCSDDELFNTFHIFETIKNMKWKGPNLLGLHLEGPYVAPSQKGALNSKYMRDPIRSDFLRLLDASPYILRMTVAPELPGALELGDELNKRGILASIGHSDAMYEQVVQACEHGYTLLTHFYSSMSSIKRVNAYRHLGVVESGYLLDDLTVEIIADGKHLPKELLQFIVKFKPYDHICLITDSMRGAGLPEGSSVRLGSKNDGLDAVIKDGVAFLPDYSSFAGSICTTDRCLKTMVNLAGVPLTAAIRMLTVNPARMLGIGNKKGMICEGMDADICIFDDRLNMKAVFVSGELLAKND